MEWIATLVCWLIGMALALPVIAFWAIKPMRFVSSRSRVDLAYVDDRRRTPRPRERVR